MKCPRCGHEIVKRRKRCEICGQDISIYERLQRISNSFYNKGLERAKVRDLTGAIEMLKKSLELNKENTEARNLLGLVYFEMGEVVAALGEWVISKHFDPEGTTADSLIEKVQADTVAFDSMNQTIRKYNIALSNAKNQDDDLAVLQLKRVISMHPNYVRALLLLALIYLKNCEYEKSRRCLMRVLRIDVGNVTALRYLEEIKLHTQAGTSDVDAAKETEENPYAPQFAPTHSYQEDKPNFIAFLTFFIGVVIGVAVIYFLAVPNIRKNILEEYNQKEKDYSAVLSTKDSTISSLESNIRILEDQISELEKTLRREEGYVLTDYAPLVDLLNEYRNYLAQEQVTQEETEALADAVLTLDISEMAKENKNAAELYNFMKDDMTKRAAADPLEEGLSLYAQEKQEEALVLLHKAERYTPDDPELLYHLGRIYHSKGETETAKQYYETLMEKHPDSIRCQEAKTYLSYITEKETAE